MKKESKIMRKMLLIIIAVFAFSLSNSLVAAGCCYKTSNNHYCVDNFEAAEGLTCQQTVTAGSCSSSYSDCTTVTCLMPDGTCKASVPRLDRTQVQGGAIDTDPINQISECKYICCNILPTTDYGIMTRRACYNLSESKGFDPQSETFGNYVKIYEITDYDQCKQNIADSIKDRRGCCIKKEGICEYTTKEQCESGYDFKFDDLYSGGNAYCYKFDECAVEHCSKASCGDKPGDEYKICSFDSQGNQEECAPETLDAACSAKIPNYNDCQPSSICKICNEENGCIDNITTTTISKFKPYCETTACKLELAGSQKITPDFEKGKITIDVENNGTVNLPSGQSICYNFYGSFVKHEGDKDYYEIGTDASEVANMSGISSELQNQKIVCSYGKLSVVPFGPDRSKLCKLDETNMSATQVDNKWQECRKCGVTGENDKTLDTIGDIFAPGSFLGATKITVLLAEHCNKEKCEELGDCIYHQDFVFKPLGIVQLGETTGSCDPIYTPGVSDETYKECGGGGDPVWNTCKPDECYALGDFDFKPLGAGRYALKKGLHFIGGTFVEKADTAVVPCGIMSVATYGLTPKALEIFLWCNGYTPAKLVPEITTATFAIGKSTFGGIVSGVLDGIKEALGL